MGKGHSQARPRIPRRRFRICRMGTGRTAGSRLVVRKSQNTLGQKNPSRAAAIWSVEGGGILLVVGWEEGVEEMGI